MLKFVKTSRTRSEAWGKEINFLRTRSISVDNIYRVGLTDYRYRLDQPDYDDEVFVEIIKEKSIAFGFDRTKKKFLSPLTPKVKRPSSLSSVSYWYPNPLSISQA